MTFREWEAAMLAAGATRLRVASVKEHEYTAEAVIERQLITVSGDDLEIVCARLLEKCRDGK